MSRFVTFGRRLSPSSTPPDPAPDHAQADPDRIARALAHASAKPSGGWVVLDASDRIAQPRRFVVAGRTFAVWRGPDGTVHGGPDECPHMGAPLCEGRVDDRGRVICPWHGLALGDRRHGGWSPIELHDDGLLTWLRVPELEDRPTKTPILPERPERFVYGVIRAEARCEPRDVIANRLDPWHGVHFHPSAFLRLRVLDEDETQITVRVVYKVLGPIAMEVDARFTCPDPRTIVMTIVDGDGKGSIVETHATPIDRERTSIVEATLATSDRLLFPLFPQRLMRPLIERRAAALWKDDAAYAERLASLRAKKSLAPHRQRSEAMKPRGGME
jgi:hypothetical protein